MIWKIKKFAPKITKAEWKLRHALEKANIPFITQERIVTKGGAYTVDFLVNHNIVVEVDGSSHRGKQLMKDAKKNADLILEGFIVYRVRDPEVFNNIYSVVATIKKLVEGA